MLFLAALLADFFAPLREEVFPAAPRLDFLALRLGSVDLPREGDDSANSSYEAGVEAGVGVGVFSIGSGSIQPEPDQPISM